MTERVAAKPAELRRDPPVIMRFPRWQDWRGAGRESSGRLDQAQLLQNRHAVVEAHAAARRRQRDVHSRRAGCPPPEHGGEILTGDAYPTRTACDAGGLVAPDWVDGEVP